MHISSFSDVAGRKISSLNWGVLVLGWNTIGIEGLSHKPSLFCVGRSRWIEAVSGGVSLKSIL